MPHGAPFPFAPQAAGTKVFFLTDRAGLDKKSYSDRLRALFAARPAAVVLRDKASEETAYRALAEEALALAEENGVFCLLHGSFSVASALGAPNLHLPLPMLRALTARERAGFACLGASCHSLAEAKEAEALGTCYLFFGHVFPTDCKPGLAGRGLDALAAVCAAVRLPVVALGGITPEKVPAVLAAGAAGVAVMHSAMTCPDPAILLAALRQSGEVRRV